jgi:cation transport regulator ChaB
MTKLEELKAALDAADTACEAAWAAVRDANAVDAYEAAYVAAWAAYKAELKRMQEEETND